MRLVSRLVAVIVALVLAAGMSSALVSPAQAAKPKHEVKAGIKELGNSNKFVVFGKVPTAPGQRVKILRNAGGGKYSVYKNVKIKGNGKFRAQVFQIGRKPTCFRVEIPASGGYKKTTVQLDCIVLT